MIFNKVNTFVARFVALATGLLIIVASFLVVIEVALRYGFNAPTLWSAELVTYLCGTTYVIAGVYAQAGNNHVSMDFLYQGFRPRIRIMADAVAAVCLIGFCAALTWGGGNWAWDAIERGLRSDSPWGPPLAPARIMIPLGAFLLLVFGIAKLLESARKIRAESETTDDEGASTF